MLTRPLEQKNTRRAGADRQSSHSRIRKTREDVFLVGSKKKEEGKN